MDYQNNGQWRDRDDPFSPHTQTPPFAEGPGPDFYDDGFDPIPPRQKKPRKTISPRSKATLKVVALCLVCALAGGMVYPVYQNITGQSGGTTLYSGQRTPTQVDVTTVDTSKELTTAEIYAKYVSSCVGITVDIVTTNIFGQQVTGAAAGSGFVITEDGYILTNYHVIDGANSIKVTFSDGKEYTATYVGGEEKNDIAVIKVDAAGLTPVVIGKSSDMLVGEQVTTIGNPLGELTFSESTGIISALDRTITMSDGTQMNMIQTDCAINSGNSGGPLFNTYGEVIGIVSAKYSTYANTTVEGLGFAIPINDVYAMVQDIMENGYVTDKAYLGITGSTVTQQLQMQFNLPASSGVFVYSIEPNGAAAKSGLQAGDIITKLGNSEIASMTDLMNAKKSYKAGDTAPMTVNRSGETVSFDFTFGTQPQTDPQAEESSTQNTPQNDNSYYYYYGNPFG